ncbi:hypothetical protein WEU32_06430 [Brevundimonas sp. BH3]|uniref:hypothetical protein n=1 Tax=Brevundimonas sp. BH3 TaxID=3133089 RepID=UPI00324381CB
MNETNITAKKFSETKIKLDTEVNNKVNEIRSSYVSKIEELLSDFKERISERSSITDDKLNNVEEEANSKLDKIVQLYGLAARDSVTGGHKQIADNEGIYANKWRRATVLIILATIGWLFYSLKFYNPITSNDRDFWFAAAKSLSLTTIMISFAVYASKQAALHRLNEKKSRAFFLQVQAFDPFIQDLPDSVRQELKRNISERIFSGDNSESDKLLLDNSDYKSLDKTLEIMESLKRIFSTDK